MEEKQYNKIKAKDEKGREYWQDLDFSGNYTKVSNEFLCDMKYLSRNAILIYEFLFSGTNFGRDGNYHVWPSWATISENTGIKNKNGISNAIFELVMRGWIIDIRKRNNQSNIYYLNPTSETNQALITKMEVNRDARSDIMKEFSVGKPAPEKGKSYDWRKVGTADDTDRSTVDDT